MRPHVFLHCFFCHWLQQFSVKLLCQLYSPVLSDTKINKKKHFVESSTSLLELYILLYILSCYHKSHEV